MLMCVVRLLIIISTVVAFSKKGSGALRTGSRTSSAEAIYIMAKFESM